MQGNYDRVAGFYDGLAKAVFGHAIGEAQRCMLALIPPEAKILVVGGGTGWILEEIARQHPEGLQLTYVEISRNMLARSRKRKGGKNRVSFVHGAIQEVCLEETYEVVITPFLFDNFSGNTASQVFQKINGCLREGGLWLFTDFRYPENSFRQRVLLRSMYLFFGFLCQLETSRLPDTALLFHRYGYRPIRQETFFKHFILSAAYRKQ